MTEIRYGTFTEFGHLSRMPRYGVIDRETGKEYGTVGPETAEQLAELLNQRDCRFNCRAKREADYLQGWVDRDRDCPIKESGKRCAKRYVDGAESGLLIRKSPLPTL